ncbi:Glycosyl transferase family 2 [Metamycoplasma arthritidis]|uniref:Glycosyltransferase n=1 Tax=Metamycoplasma arthritidis (strain 158L3-1) TaxID=243272 RepID=B3PNG7_META1|nr:glycosyltransferase [Metamycoplasma arthritidis]ACF07569.1 glycosyltransferase [Metamycoplasma arthritidis 158L3-1]VEU79077.1 Glycosyl transferase family 2 [Metamycoplasma arthritidis]
MNQLTIIIPVYHPSKPLEAILHNILKQKDQTFNVILAVDKPTDHDYEAIKAAKKILNGRLKIIINTNHQNINNVIKQSLSYVETKYVYIFYSYTHLKSEFTLHINNFLKTNSPDFIEILAYCRGLVAHDYTNLGLQENVVINLNDDKSPIAYMTPVSFNFIVNSNIAKEAYKNIQARNINMQYSSEYKYKSIILAKSFAYITSTWVEDYNNQLILFNPKNTGREWNAIFAFAKDKDFGFDELIFARKIHLGYYVAMSINDLKFKKTSAEYKSISLMKNFLIKEIEDFDVQNYVSMQTNKYCAKWNLPSFSKKEVTKPLKWEDLINTFSSWQNDKNK